MVSIKLHSQELQNVCENLSQIDDIVTITSCKNYVRFSAIGEFANASIRINDVSIEDQESTINIVHGAMSQSFILKYLLIFTKATGLSRDVRLALSPDAPMLVEYAIIDDNNINVGHLRFYLPPTAETDDEN